VKVDHAQARQAEQVGLEDVAVRDDHTDVRDEGAQAREECGIAGALGCSTGTSSASAAVLTGVG